jgi:hypothetical protein
MDESRCGPICVTTPTFPLRDWGNLQKNLNQVSRSSGQDMNRGLPDHEANTHGLNSASKPLFSLLSKGLFFVYIGPNLPGTSGERAGWIHKPSSNIAIRDSEKKHVKNLFVKPTVSKFGSWDLPNESWTRSAAPRDLAPNFFVHYHYSTEIFLRATHLE